MEGLGEEPEAQMWLGDKNSIPMTVDEGAEPKQSLKSVPFTRQLQEGGEG